MAIYRDAPLGEKPSPHNWEFPDKATREAESIPPLAEVGKAWTSNLNKQALQLDDRSLWILIDSVEDTENPGTYLTTWQAVSGTTLPNYYLGLRLIDYIEASPTITELHFFDSSGVDITPAIMIAEYAGTFEADAIDNSLATYWTGNGGISYFPQLFTGVSNRRPEDVAKITLYVHDTRPMCTQYDFVGSEDGVNWRTLSHFETEFVVGPVELSIYPKLRQTIQRIGFYQTRTVDKFTIIEHPSLDEALFEVEIVNANHEIGDIIKIREMFDRTNVGIPGCTLLQEGYGEVQSVLVLASGEGTFEKTGDTFWIARVENKQDYMYDLGTINATQNVNIWPNLSNIQRFTCGGAYTITVLLDFAGTWGLASKKRTIELHIVNMGLGTLSLSGVIWTLSDNTTTTSLSLYLADLGTALKTSGTDVFEFYKLEGTIYGKLLYFNRPQNKVIFFKNNVTSSVYLTRDGLADIPQNRKFPLALNETVLFNGLILAKGVVSGNLKTWEIRGTTSCGATAGSVTFSDVVLTPLIIGGEYWTFSLAADTGGFLCVFGGDSNAANVSCVLEYISVFGG